MFARPAKEQVISNGLNPIQEKPCRESVISVALTEHLTVLDSSYSEKRPQASKLPDLEHSEESTQKGAHKSMKANGSSKDWQEEVDWTPKPKSPDHEWEVEW